SPLCPTPRVTPVTGWGTPRNASRGRRCHRNAGSTARGPLAARATVRGTVHEGLTNDRRPAAAARLVPATVGVEAAFEVATLPVDVDVQPVEGGAAHFQGLAHDVPHVPQQFQRLGLRE